MLVSLPQSHTWQGTRAACRISDGEEDVAKVTQSMAAVGLPVSTTPVWKVLRVCTCQNQRVDIRRCAKTVTLGRPPRFTSRARASGHSAMELWADGIVAVVVTGAALLLLISVALGLSIACHPLWLVRWIQKKQPQILFHKPTQEKVVALTLDDGPHANITPQLLKVLKENGCRATWFIIGEHMDRCPGLVEQIHAEGHEVGNHTMRDVASWSLSPEEFEEQLIAVDNRINSFFQYDTSDNPIKWFRPGHGFYNRKIVNVCKAHGYRIALGSLFPLDHMFKDQARLLVNNMLWRMHPGAVIILHDRLPQWEQTPQVLRMLLPELRRQGYMVVTLSELMNLQHDSHLRSNV